MIVALLAVLFHIANTRGLFLTQRLGILRSSHGYCHCCINTKLVP